MESIKHVLQWIYDNYMIILCVIGVITVIYQRVMSGTKIKIREVMLALVEQSEDKYKDWVKAGSIKRAEVIAKIYADYPILSLVIDQDKMIKYIDDTIDEALVSLREILEKNQGNESKE